MARTLDHGKRSRLLAAVVAYIDEHGLADLSLRPLAAALGTSSRMLIYYFGTKEELLIQALGTVPRPDLAALFDDVTDPAGLRKRLTELWTSMSVGESAVSTRILLQFMSVAAVQRGPYSPIVEDAVEKMVGVVATAIRACHGTTEAESRTRATAVISGLRGVLLDRLATGDVARTESAALALIAGAGETPISRAGSRTVGGDEQP